MEPWLRAFLITLGGLALLLQPGPFLNDEVGQMAALWSLAEGSLLIEPDLPEGYDPIRGWGSIHAPEADEPARPNSGSTMTNVWALPVLFMLRGFSAFLGPMGAVGLLAAVAVGGGVWAWRGSQRTAVAAGIVLFVPAMAMQVVWHPPASPYLEAAALQMVSAAFHAFVTALLYDVLRTRVERPVLGAALYAFGTPALFCGLNLKYHGVAIACAAVVIWLYQEGHRTSPLRTGLAFAVAGLAVWNHIPNGLLVVASLGLMAVPSVVLGIRPVLARAGAAVAGLSIGVAMEAWERSIQNALAVRDRFIQIGGGADVGDQLERQAERGRLRHTVWNDPEGPFDAFRQMVFWVEPTTPSVGAALPMLALVPLLVLVGWTYRRPIIERVGRPLMAWPIVHLVVLLGLFGRGVFSNGEGFDLRQASTLWPYVALPLAIVASHAPRILISLRVAAATAGAILLGVYLPMFLVRAGRSYSALTKGPTYDLVDPLRYVGIVVAVLALVVWLVPRVRPWRGHAVAVAISVSFLVQTLLQLGPARSLGQAIAFPFIAWPLAVLEWFVEWFMMGV